MLRNNTPAAEHINSGVCGAEIADDFHQRATLPEGTIATSAEGKNLEGTILAFEVLRTAISVGIGNIAQLKEDIKAVSSVPDLISATPTMSGIKSSSEDLGDHTTIMRESAVEQEKTESDRTGVTRRLVPGESEMLDDAHTHTDLTPIPSATGIQGSFIS
ncbi:hypothetical protein Y032_0136g1990 [Ancylostoma ceylanicum]|uniref:Uncharacterized protein n=1 Tax=Ancylostoma ceylanicum TaxID=53326 RepID=A0A016T5E4_9BILA|nr:hypothetical protein Y032_0136g1990 [Ancylostoma ceylanicum]